MKSDPPTSQRRLPMTSSVGSIRDIFGHRRHIGKTVVYIGLPKPVGSRVRKIAKPLLTLAEGVLGQFSFGDIPEFDRSSREFLHSRRKPATA